MERTGDVAVASSPVEPGFDLDRWRADIPLLESFVPLNACSHSPQTRQTRAAADAYLDSWNREGMDWMGWMKQVEEARAAFAALINASPDEVAVTTSVSAATASVASALDFSGERNQIVISEAEFPSVSHVWHAQEKNGAHVEWARLDGDIIGLDAYTRVISDRTAIVSACHSWYQNGYKQDIGRITKHAHENGALVYVDAYQSLGTCPVDVHELGVDFLSGGSLKYLMGVPGIAFLYIRKNLIARLHPGVTGWFGRKNPFTFDLENLDWADTARRFDTGTPPIPSAAISCAGMKILADVGLPTIGAWTTQLSTRLVDRANEAGMIIHGSTDPSLKTPATAIVTPAPSHEIEHALREEGILASGRGPVIRLAPHFYNTLGEMDHAIEVLQRVFESSTK